MQSWLLHRHCPQRSPGRKSGVKKWLEQNEVQLIEMKPLAEVQRGSLVDELERICKIDLSEDARRVLIEKSDGTPYHLILTTKKYLAKVEGRKITQELAAAVIPKSSEDIWKDIRNEWEDTERRPNPCSKPWLFFITPTSRRIMKSCWHTATQLKRSKRKYLLPWIAGRRVNHAVKIVKPYGIYHQNTFVFPDVAVETLIPAEAGLTPPGTFCSRLPEILQYSRPAKIQHGSHSTAKYPYGSWYFVLL